ncbi:MAG: ATP-binding cassette domain-containing protein [Gammaproteobacteria bacterium]|nr:ATP-binding cassette domain-containing protein [Gammaproteobacteria bacterium]
MTILECVGLSLAFGGVHAVADVDLRVEVGELFGLIGPNGAGKTTLLRLLAGALRPDGGEVLYREKDVTRMPLYRRAQLGCVVTHQVARPFRRMTIAENVTLAAGARSTLHPWRALLAVDSRRARGRAFELLERVGIADSAGKSASTVPLGILKRMQVARALALEPQLLMLDEPLAGLNHHEAARFAEELAELNRGGLTLVVVEHNLREISRIARRLAVLHEGALLADGAPDEVMARRDVRDAYLGTPSSGIDTRA